MPNIPNINLKFTAVGVVLLSILLIGGSLIFSLFNKPQTSSSLPNQASKAFTSCTIGDNSFTLGDNPQNECQFCDPNQNRSGWSNKQNGISCRGGKGICQNGLCVPNVKPADGSGGGSSKP